MAEYERKEKYTKPENEKELLLLAREKEKASFGFYENMSKLFFLSENIRKLLDELKAAELIHIQIVEKKLEEIGK